jgi:hypothetical protein
MFGLVRFAFVLWLAFGHALAWADFDWVSVTLDNDLFLGNDSGYTNGIYFSAFDVGTRESANMPKPDIWVQPLKWSMDRDNVSAAVNAYTFGQTMNTPNDITVKNPADNQLPYSAMLSLTNSYVVITPKFADRATTIVGVVGPSALGEEAQSFVHKIIGADQPQGWDTQLGDELVFQLSRARTWRAWRSELDRFDLLTNLDLGVGTIQSALSAGGTLRYGRNLSASYATTLFNGTRTTNPAAVDGDWFFYAGFQAGYTFNQVFFDGNTFRDSRSLEYDPSFIVASAGFAYSFRRFSISMALTDLNVLQSGSEREAVQDLTQFGTFTLAWRL